MSKKVYPGKHPMLKVEHFTSKEKDILNVLAKEFYITNGGEKISLGYNSKYKYVIISPTNIYRDMFNLDRELIVVFSPYESMESRTLDVFEYIALKHPALRIEKICNVLISNDPNVQESLNGLVKSEPESQVIIPFYSGELEKVHDSYFFRNRFKKYFYSRDLFAFEAPLRKGFFFFGRKDLIQALVNRFKSGENSGLFGLRKTGKTSLINGIERNLNKEGVRSVIIDCQDTSFNQRRWFEALYYLCFRAKELLDVEERLPVENEFTTKEASLLTERFLLACKEETNQPIFLIFDEIENISRITAPAQHWSQGTDFALFWQTLRSIFQRNEKLISYLVVGTNPTCVELPKIDNIDNPIFNHFDPLYIPGFDVQDTREMVRKLGRRMGLKFDESVYSRLTDDFGGHPFLTRHLCSLIAKNVSDLDRPVDIGKMAYKKGKEQFVINHSNFLEMIISVLKDYYPDEYKMLTMLANDDQVAFRDLAQKNPSYTAHLIGYGLVKQDCTGYDFNIDSVGEYIINQSKYQKLDMTVVEMWAEISERRNAVEQKMRQIIKFLLKANLGESKAKEVVLNIFGNPRKSKLSPLTYNDLFDASVSEIYFSDLSKIISKKWEIFKNTFDKTKQETFRSLDFINQSRADAHAKDITKEQFYYFRMCMQALEEDLENTI